MKARDLISGWPRGRSTSAFIDSPADLEFYRRRWSNRPYADPWLEDLELSVRYHEQQQAMATAYLELWRLDFEHLIRQQYSLDYRYDPKEKRLRVRRLSV